MKTQKKIRLDLLLVERKLVTSREKAQALIMSGNVLVGETPLTKPGTSVPDDSPVRIRGQDHPYVSRGGLKLKKALDVFQVVVSGKVALDVGASTGGFTQVLLEGGAAKVYAVDVGHNQMDWLIRNDPRVECIEKVNARKLDFERIGQKVDIIVVDVSFISLEKIFPALLGFMKPDSSMVTLIKPQFEVGRNSVGKGGIVSSEEDRLKCVERITLFAQGIGLTRVELINSPITGD